MDGELYHMMFFFVKPKTAYELRISDGSSDVCSSDLVAIAEKQETAVNDVEVAREILAPHARRVEVNEAVGPDDADRDLADLGVKVGRCVKSRVAALVVQFGGRAERGRDAGDGLAHPVPGRRLACTRRRAAGASLASSVGAGVERGARREIGRE